MQSEEDLKELFRALRRAYHTKLFGERTVLIAVNPPVNGIVGEFSPHPTLPNIGVVAVYMRTPPDPFKMFCTLCHELGHARSWLDGTRTGEYLQAHEQFKTDRALLSDEQKELILAEEALAWRYGLTLAQSVGLENEAAFKDEAQRAIQFYFDALGLPPKPIFPLPAA